MVSSVTEEEVTSILNILKLYVRGLEKTPRKDAAYYMRLVSPPKLEN